MVACNNVSQGRYIRMPQMQICIWIKDRCRYVKILFSHYCLTLLVFVITCKPGLGESAGLFLVDIGNKFLYRRGDGDRKQYSQKAGKFGSYDKSEYDQKRWHADHLFYHHGIDKMSFKLLYHYVEPGNEQECGKTTVGKSDCKRRYGREYLTEDRNEFKEPCDNRKQKRVRNA